MVVDEQLPKRESFATKRLGSFLLLALQENLGQQLGDEWSSVSLNLSQRWRAGISGERRDDREGTRRPFPCHQHHLLPIRVRKFQPDLVFTCPDLKKRITSTSGRCNYTQGRFGTFWCILKTSR